jgi:membrane AbrB-like protein
MKNFSFATMKCLLICLIGGALFSALHAPLPWYLGALLATAVGKIVRAEVREPKGGRQAGQVIVGARLGLYFTPAVMHQMTGHVMLMLLGALVTIVIGYLNTFLMARIARIDTKTAFFCSVPGGATEMAVLGRQFNVPQHYVALAQSLRVFLVVLIIPALFTLLGISGLDSYGSTQLPVVPGGLALFLLLAVGAGWFMKRAGLSNPWMLGPLFASVLLTMHGANLSAIPVVLTNAAQLLIGCSLGARFERRFIAEAPRFIKAVLVTVFVMLAMSSLAALVLADCSAISPASMELAMAPGGIAEMCLTAKTLHLAVPIVASFHLTRLVALLLLTPPVFRTARRLGSLFAT